MYKRVVSVSVAAVLLIIPVLIITLPKKEFSENENRILQKFPTVSVENIVSGQFSDEVEKYISDHFPGRDRLVSLKSTVQKSIGYKEMNGVFVSKDRLIQHIEKPDTTIFTERMGKLTANIDQTKVKLHLMLVPTDAAVYSEKIPANAPDIVDEKNIIEQIYSDVSCDTIDVLSELEIEKNNSNVFYNLDHHWNYNGAYCGYKSFCEAVGIPVKAKEKFEKKVLSDEFRGTLYSKVLIRSMKPDVIEAVDLQKDELVVHYVDKKKDENSFYDYSFLKKKDKYSVFGGGNQALQIVENENAESEDELVVVKDSFANCMIPFLIYHYRRIHVIDPRYYMPHISDYVNQNEKVSDVLILYNIDSFNSNNGIMKIK